MWQEPANPEQTSADMRGTSKSLTPKTRLSGFNVTSKWNACYKVRFNLNYKDFQEVFRVRVKLFSILEGYIKSLQSFRLHYSHGESLVFSRWCCTHSTLKIKSDQHIPVTSDTGSDKEHNYHACDKSFRIPFTLSITLTSFNTEPFQVMQLTRGTTTWDI